MKYQLPLIAERRNRALSSIESKDGRYYSMYFFVLLGVINFQAKTSPRRWPTGLDDPKGH